MFGRSAGVMAYGRGGYSVGCDPRVGVSWQLCDTYIAWTYINTQYTCIFQIANPNQDVEFQVQEEAPFPDPEVHVQRVRHVQPGADPGV